MINLATVSKMDWSREKPKDPRKVGDSHSKSAQTLTRAGA
jgi:hypothetical protein